MHRGRTMANYKLAFVAFDSAKDKHAVAIAEDEGDGEVRYFGEIENSPDAVKKFVAKLSRRYDRLVIVWSRASDQDLVESAGGMRDHGWR
jgi:transposase